MNVKHGWVEHDPKYIQFRVYDEHPDHYIAVCNIYQYCDKGMVDSMIGKNLLISLTKSLPQLHSTYGIDKLEGYVLRDVARGCEIAAKRYKRKYTETELCTFNGREFIWIKVEL